MQTDRTRYVPSTVKELADQLHTDTGQEPEIDQTEPTAWRLTLRNDRVRMTVDFRRTTSRKIKWDGSELWVDGEPRPLCKDAKEFIRLFNDPGSGGVKAWTPEPTPPECGVEDAPGKVRAIARQLTDAGLENVRVGHVGASWTVFMVDDRSDLRIFFEETGAGVRPPTSRPMTLMIDGEDRTGLLANGLTSALRLLAGVGPDGGATPSPRIAHTQDPARNASVEVRRAAVIRV